MQLTFAFLDPSDHPPGPSAPARISAAWDHLDKASRLTALAILTRLIAQMLAADRKATSND